MDTAPGVAPVVPRSGALVGSLEAARVRSGVARGPRGLFQRRVRPAVFGEPAFEAELTPAGVCPARPHAIAYDAWVRMVAAARADGVPDTEAADGGVLGIHSAYRSVAFQAEVWAYRLAERRKARADAGLPPLPEPELGRQQRKWTAAPGMSAHHTGLALDLGLYRLGKRAARRHPAYAWLAEHARRFGFYPYLPEAWHWEYNPPGLVEQLAALRRGLAAGRDCSALLRAPEEIPVARPAPRPGRRAR